jgi:hypothetical protein
MYIIREDMPTWRQSWCRVRPVMTVVRGRVEPGAGALGSGAAVA